MVQCRQLSTGYLASSAEAKVRVLFESPLVIRQFKLHGHGDLLSCMRAPSSAYSQILKEADKPLIFFPFGATAPIWAMAYLHETLRFTSGY
jgi:hypothetical protein